MESKLQFQNGNTFPLGATVYPQGVNFSIYSKNASEVELLLFEGAEDPRPSRIISLAPRVNRTYFYWHTFVPGLRAGQIYGYRVYGPYVPEKGHRFDSQKVLLDPYGKALIIPPNYSRKTAGITGDNTATAMKSVVADVHRYDWEGDAPLGHPFSDTIIYEMHVRGFTRHPNSGLAEAKRGTYAGLIEKIPYLRDLGITAVELLPIFQYDEQDAPVGFKNYWGYSPVSFFIPHNSYSSVQDPLGLLDEFRDMVKALHRAGIEVILDVVYNHTAEGPETGPTLSYRGLENRAYYILDHSSGRYADFSGCGNTFNAGNSIARRMIIDSLHYWVQEMHIDGFRFDLASILSRDLTGLPLANPPLLWDIESDPLLAGTKLIAEAWDAGGLYQVGRFVGESWKEWNGKFRDDLRSFLKGDRGMVSKAASRLLGSPDLYGHQEREAEQSINFITCHDGFTLNDLVSYDHKHNEANGEDNRDGTNDNFSWNCGVEGPTEDPDINNLRNRQMKNFLTVTVLALGAPMLLMGDEMGRTQMGNNNAYCQDNEMSWLDWSLQESHADVRRFLKNLIAARAHKSGAPAVELSLNQILKQARVQWHGVKLNQPDWGPDSRSIAMTVWTRRSRLSTHIMINAYWEPLKFELPLLEDPRKRSWHRWIDTAKDSPNDIIPWAEAPIVSENIYRVEARSIVVLVEQTTT
ncbi:MAG TPA: glycogen debranching protein GlgX [Thermodesulfobacteriota bacterium]|nr:glycogen debranching protein GlgX [Thermodesulfobacteriota bacterium]